MDAIFEKAIDLKHKNFKIVEWVVPQIESDSDYTEKELAQSIEFLKNKNLIDYKNIRFKSYKEWGFPKWKRAKLNGYDPKKYIEKINPDIIGKAKSIDTIDKEGLEILAKYDFEGANRKFLLMSDTFFNHGYYFKAEENEDLGTTIIKYDQEQILENTVFNLKKGSKLTLVRIINSEKDLFRTTSLRGVVEENAELNIINVNLLNENDINIDNALFELKESSKVNVYDLHLGGKVSAPHYIFRMSGKYAEGNIKPYFLGDKDNVIDMLYLIRFYAPESTGNIKGKGALKDSAKAIFRGFLDLKKGAKEATAAEEESTLLLSEKARAEAFPSLLVDENEVNASHAASVGTLDEQKLYYLMTRGFSKLEAKKLMSFGIFEPFLDEIEKYHAETAGVIRNAIESKI
ncbi:SufD family Fe-S cluster assembly protein [Geotoga petraea]|jgi:Fe-S cluster assembly scaffold protein SufB|uniref:Fe-S cluster assembly scaffold protein SufB n=1 Tax=Geotoga petraea TaxID=28234 RepID=A0A1G6M6U4_9BACT|nr:SufD family Fe-S cluster assembly protein [Geotoga petraea]SDC51034.1 Fe-S cluster assembly scaffold protein SufB [Geotoga petraea]